MWPSSFVVEKASLLATFVFFKILPMETIAQKAKIVQSGQPEGKPKV
jgi:hypothetical protein